MDEVKLKIQHKNHEEVVLINQNGDTFTYNPRVWEEFEDFLLSAKTKPEKINFEELLNYINQCTGRGFRLINKSVQQKYKARLRDGYTRKDIANAIKNACKSEHHKDNGFQHCTPEFFSRASTIDRYGFEVNTKKVKKAPQKTFNDNIPVE